MLVFSRLHCLTALKWGIAALRNYQEATRLYFSSRKNLHRQLLFATQKVWPLDHLPAAALFCQLRRLSKSKRQINLRS